MPSRKLIPAYTDTKFTINPRNTRLLTGEANMAKGAALDAKRGTIFLVEEGSKTVDVRLVTDPKHPLYDARVKEDPADSFVANVAHYGIKEPVIGVKAGEDDGKQIVFIVAGRKRFKAWKAANKLLKERGHELLPLPVKLEHGEADDTNADENLIGVMILENEIREDDKPMNRARKAAQHLNRSQDEEKTAMSFGWPISTLRMHIDLLKLHKDVQTMVDAGDLSPSAAAQIAKLPLDQQIKVAEAALEGEGHGGRKATVKKVQAKVKAAKKAAKGGGGGAAESDGEGAEAVGKKKLKRIRAFFEHKSQDGRLSDAKKAWMLGVQDLVTFIVTGEDTDDRFEVPEDFDPRAKAVEGAEA